jgi:polysaccharide biosynthesis protein PelE
MSQSKEFKYLSKSVVFIFLLMVTIIEFIGLFDLIDKERYTVFLSLHILLILTCSFFLYLLNKLNYKVGTLSFYIYSFSFFSIFGAAGNIFVFFAVPLFKKFSKPFMEWYETLFPDSSQTKSENIYHELVSGRFQPESTHKVVSFHELIKVGNSTQKQDVIQLMVRNFEPKYAKLIIQTLNDEDPFVRVQAATAVSIIEHKFLKTVLALQEKLEETPDDSELLYKMGVLYDDYSYTGLLEKEREHENRKYARDYLEKALVLDPHHKQALKSLIRIHLRKKLFSEAIILLEKQMGESALDETLLFWYIEALYNLKRFRELSLFIQTHHQQLMTTISKDHPLKEVIAFALAHNKETIHE